MKIPKRFKLLASTTNVVFDDRRLDDLNAYGYHEPTTNVITLSRIDGIKDICEDLILDTFYHERTHAILYAMGKRELNKDEEFVDLFSKLLRQADETAEY